MDVKEPRSLDRWKTISEVCEKLPTIILSAANSSLFLAEILGVLEPRTSERIVCLTKLVSKVSPFSFTLEIFSPLHFVSESSLLPYCVQKVTLSRSAFSFRNR